MFLTIGAEIENIPKDTCPITGQVKIPRNHTPKFLVIMKEYSWVAHDLWKTYLTISKKYWGEFLVQHSKNLLGIIPLEFISSRLPQLFPTCVKSQNLCAGLRTSSHFLRVGVLPLPSSTRHLESGRKAVEPSGPSCRTPSEL